MPRTQMIDGVSVPLTDEEETARDAEEASWEEEKPARAMVSLRKKRNILLVSSDWTQASDSPLTDEVKTTWATYREELRDLPESADPADPTWPDAPE
jgi:hypothetical protein